ncbi:hypothetical protein CPC08DRAFT_729541, partial [Agrocybe pediades]
SQREYCSFTHRDEGKARRGKIVRYKPVCSSELIIFEPIDNTIRKALVLPKNPHNHPRHLYSKVTRKQKEFVREAVKASGNVAVAPKALRISATTSTLLEGATWESKVGALTDKMRLRRFLNTINDETYPRGFDWEGVQYEVDKREQKLPPQQRYIHSVTTKGNCHCVVTMLYDIVQHIHSARFLVLDYTFKRVGGDMNEWEIAGTIERYKMRVTYASLYCDSATREAFRILFDEFFDAVERVTGKKLQFKLINPESKLLVLLFDAEAAQIQACGDKLLQLNDPEVSKITTKDPLKIVQYFTKTCTQHFTRNIDKLPKSIVPTETILRLKSFMDLASDDEISAWHEFCKSSPYKEVINWYNQKLAHPWYLPSLNRFLSKVPEASWDATPADSNIGEGAHAARNAETGRIGRAVLAAILDARARDEAIAKTLKEYEQNYMTGDRFNLPYDRSKRSAARREATRRKTQAVDSARQTYGSLEKEVEELSGKRQESLARSKEIQDRLKAIREELRDPECSKTSILAKNLNDEKKLLEKESKEGVAMRKTWQEQSSKLKESMTELKKNELNGARVHDPRSSATPPSSSPTRGEPARLLVPQSTTISPRQSLSHKFVPETSSPLKSVSNYYDDDDLDAANDEQWQGFGSDDGAPVAARVEPPVNEPLEDHWHEPEHFQHPESENWDYDYDSWDVEPALDDAGTEAWRANFLSLCGL